MPNRRWRAPPNPLSVLILEAFIWWGELSVTLFWTASDRAGTLSWNHLCQASSWVLIKINWQSFTFSKAKEFNTSWLIISGGSDFTKASVGYCKKTLNISLKRNKVCGLVIWIWTHRTNFLNCPNIIQLCSCDLGEFFSVATTYVTSKKMLQLRQLKMEEKNVTIHFRKLLILQRWL